MQPPLLLQQTRVKREKQQRTGKEANRKRKWVAEGISTNIPEDNLKHQYTSKDWVPVDIFEFFLDHDLVHFDCRAVSVICKTMR